MTHPFHPIWLVLPAMLLSGSCRQTEWSLAPEVKPLSDPEITVITIVTGSDIIWGMDVLPDGDLIYGEKKGRIFRRSGDKITELTGFPAVKFLGQGGLMDVRAHPDYAANGWLYATYCAETAARDSEVKLVRFKVKQDRIAQLEEIFSTGGGNTWNNHFGSRIVFDKQKFLYLGIGEGGSGSFGGPNATNRNSQDTRSNWGKVHRMRDNGDIPQDNPVLPGNSKPTTLYSYGHRNPQGLAMHPGTGEIWETEHGPRGGDEINILAAGENYGWPTYSLGVNYNGVPVSDNHRAPGIREPIHVWTPSIGVCGVAFIDSKAFGSWNGHFLATGLAGQKLYRYGIKDNKIASENVWMEKMGRFRNVIQGSDGAIYISLEGPGRILKVTAR